MSGWVSFNDDEGKAPSAPSSTASAFGPAAQASPSSTAALFGAVAVPGASPLAARSFHPEANTRASPTASNPFPAFPTLNGANVFSGAALLTGQAQSSAGSLLRPPVAGQRPTFPLFPAAAPQQAAPLAAGLASVAQAGSQKAIDPFSDLSIKPPSRRPPPMVASGSRPAPPPPPSAHSQPPAPAAAAAAPPQPPRRPPPYTGPPPLHVPQQQADSTAAAAPPVSHAKADVSTPPARPGASPFFPTFATMHGKVDAASSSASQAAAQPKVGAAASSVSSAAVATFGAPPQQERVVHAQASAASSSVSTVITPDSFAMLASRHNEDHTRISGSGTGSTFGPGAAEPLTCLRPAPLTQPAESPFPTFEKLQLSDAPSSSGSHDVWQQQYQQQQRTSSSGLPPSYSSAMQMSPLPPYSAAAGAAAAPATPPPPAYEDAFDMLAAGAPHSYGAAEGMASAPPSYTAAADMPPPPPYAEAGAYDAPSPPPPAYDDAQAYSVAPAPAMVWPGEQPQDDLDWLVAQQRQQRQAQLQQPPPEPLFRDDRNDVFGLEASSRASSGAVGTIGNVMVAATSVDSGALPGSDAGGAAEYDDVETEGVVSGEVGESRLPHQICIEVRLPPLKPKDSTVAKRLAAAPGCLFAAPGQQGSAMTQWFVDFKEMQFVLPAGLHERSREDRDSAPACNVRLPEALDMDSIRSTAVDPMSGRMWTGHKDGKVACWALSADAPARYIHHWQAHQLGKVSGLTVNQWGELWTASTTGTIRAWIYMRGERIDRPPVKLFECKRSKVAFGIGTRGTGLRPHSNARALAASANGRVVWSTGKASMAIWCAYTGEFLGSIMPGQASAGGTFVGAGSAAGYGSAAVPGVGGGGSGSGYVYVPGQEDDSENMLRIDTSQGIDDAVLAKRPFKPRPEPEGLGEEADDEPQIGMQLLKGVTMAAKFAAKLGKKIKENVADAAVATAGGAGSGGGGGERGDPGEPTQNQQGHSNRGSIKVLLAAPDRHSTMLVGYKKGLLEAYTEGGRLRWWRELAPGIKCGAVVGPNVWLGCPDGTIKVLELDKGSLLASWRAHVFPVTSLAAHNGIVYSLSKPGAIRAWPAAPPSPRHLTAWRDSLVPCLVPHSLRVFATTWNVNETRPSRESLDMWLEGAVQGDADVVVVALQEVVMSTSSVATDAVFSMLSKSALERGSQLAQWWATEINTLLNRRAPYVRVALRQLASLLLIVFTKAKLAEEAVGEVSTASVACGVMNIAGNKGAVAVAMSIFRRRAVFVCSHFAAHQERVEERNADYARIVKLLRFDDSSETTVKEVQGRQQQQQQQQYNDPTGSGRYGLGISGMTSTSSSSNLGQQDIITSGGQLDEEGVMPQQQHQFEYGPGMTEAELVVWAGDFNYRIKGSYEQVRDLANANNLKPLFDNDQCRQEMAKGTIFRGLAEPLPDGFPRFPPTYKFDKGIAASEQGKLPYDSSEKQRVPAWTDRIFYRGSRRGTTDVEDEAVVVSVPSARAYNAVMEVIESDHKPVYAQLDVKLPGYMQERKRSVGLRSLAAVLETAALSAPALRTSTSTLTVHPNQRAVLEVENASDAPALLTIALAPALTAAQHQQQQHSRSGGSSHSPLGDALARNARAFDAATTQLQAQYGYLHPQQSGSPQASQYDQGSSLTDSSSGLHLPAWLEVSPAQRVLLPNGRLQVSLKAVLPEAAVRGLGSEASITLQLTAVPVYGECQAGDAAEHKASVTSYVRVVVEPLRLPS